MDKPVVAYGGRDAGSVVVEAALTLLGLAYDAVDAPPILDLYR